MWPSFWSGCYKGPVPLNGGEVYLSHKKANSSNLSALCTPLNHPQYAALGVRRSAMREMFVESLWWLLHRTSSFRMEAERGHWQAVARACEGVVTTQQCPMTMVRKDFSDSKMADLYFCSDLLFVCVVK